MRLGAKLLWTLGLMVLTLSVTFYAITAQVVMRGFHNIEHDKARVNMERVLRAFEVQQQQLLAASADWANWDASYRFVQDHNAGFRRENLVPTAFSDIHVDVILFIDLTGTVVWAGALSDDGEQFSPPPPGLLALLKDEKPLRHFAPEQEYIACYASAERGPMILASRPILTSEAEGPPIGVLVMVRRIDDEFLSSLADSLLLDLSAFPVREPSDDPHTVDMLASLTKGSATETIHIDPAVAHTYALLRDLKGEPLLLLRVAMPRDIYQLGLRSCMLLAGLFAAAGALFAALLIVFQRRMVIRRLQNLGLQVGRVSLVDDRPQHVAIDGSRDELTTLAEDINRMVDRAVETRNAMEESRAQYALLFREMLSGFALHEIICDGAGKPVDYRFLAVNPAFERMTGLSAEHAIGKTVREVLPGTESHWIDTYGRVALAGKPTFFENYSAVLGKHFEVTAFCPHPGQFATIFVDVTERKLAEKRIHDLLEDSNRARRALLSILEDERRAEAALEESRADYRDLFENMASGYAHCRMIYEDGRPHDLLLLRVNSAFGAITGMQEVTGRTWRQCAPDDAINPERLAVYARVAETGVPASFEDFFKVPGKWLSLAVHSPRKGEFVVIFDDITARRTAEATLRLQGAALAAAANAIVITDQQGRIEWVNPAFSSATGYTAEEAIGHNPRELIKSGRHDTAFYRRLWNTILSGAVWRGEIMNRRKNGSLLTENMTITPVMNAKGDIEHFVAIKEDITAQKQMEEQMLRSQRLESVGRLASGLAHDLNNILSPVMLAPPILREVITDPAVLTIVDSVENSARRGAGIIKQLLAFGRGSDAHRAPLMIRSLVNEMAKLIAETFPKNIICQTHVPPEVLLVNGDSTQLHQLLMNLCVNARDAMPAGGRLTISLSRVVVDEAVADANPKAHPGPHALLSVADTGTGIPPEHLDRIFDPFFTTKPLGEGTGLGLSTAIGIVHGHQGFIDVRSVVGAGTEFRIYLPLAEAAHMHTAPVAEDSLPQGGGETVLVVDDEESIRKVAGHILEQNGYRPLMAAHGRDAMALFKRHRSEIRAVLTDLMMPEMDGAVLIESLRAAGCRVPVIVMSGYLSQPELKRAVEAQAQEFLAKPCTAADLMKALQRALAPPT